MGVLSLGLSLPCLGRFSWLRSIFPPPLPLLINSSLGRVALVPPEVVAPSAAGARRGPKPGTAEHPCHGGLWGVPLSIPVAVGFGAYLLPARDADMSKLHHPLNRLSSLHRPAVPAAQYFEQDWQPGSGTVQGALVHQAPQ